VGEVATIPFEFENCFPEPVNMRIVCTVDGDVDTDQTFENVPAGESRSATYQDTCRVSGTVQIICTVSSTSVRDPDCTISASDTSLVVCQAPDVDIEKTASPEVTASGSTISITVSNPGPVDLDPVLVSDHLPAGLTFDENQVIGGTCGAAVESVSTMGDLTWVYFSGFSLPVGGSCTIEYEIGCGEFDGEARIDTAIVEAWCDGTFPGGDSVSASDTAMVQCQAGFACPHTIGFWRQQCAQRMNGSTKVCLEGMYNLWRCVIEETGVISWQTGDKNAGYGTETTAELAGLSDEDLFARLCAQLDGPRPMTSLDMAELQYLGLMLNVCSGALPLGIPLNDPLAATVGEAIELIEEAINSGEDIDVYKTLADNINNGLGVEAQACPEGDDLFRNLPPCGDGTGEQVQYDFAAPESWSGKVIARAFPNPVDEGQGTRIAYNIPAAAGNAFTEIQIFSASGRLVRSVLSETRAPGSYTVGWDLTDGVGQRVPSGVYFYRLRVGGTSYTQKMLVLRQ
jgi:uncharacterized repeat protein (TIGR01451 family)